MQASHTQAVNRAVGPVGLALWVLLIGGLSGCGDTARLTVEQGSGPQPVLQAPRTSWLPSVHVAKAQGWPDNTRPKAPVGYQVQAFASGLDHPRWLFTLPNGDVLVAESNKPAKPKDDAQKDSLGADGGFMGWAMGQVQKYAGAGVKSADRITLLRDADGDGVAELKQVLIEGLHSPFGMALVGPWLYIANTDEVVRVPYQPGITRITQAPERVVPLPALPKNHHWTKNLIADADGTHLYVTVGSNSNVAEDGMDIEHNRAAIHQIDLSTGLMRPFATGLRNPNGMAWVPGPNGPRLWTVVNERDELGSDLVPDYMTEVVDGAFYGWPYSYWGQHVDTRVQPPRPDLVRAARTPDYALGPHTASLGLWWLDGGPLGLRLGPGLVVGQHGSWNRKPPSGYRVVLVPFADGKPAGMPRTLMDGFLSPEGDVAYGRPVGVTQDRTGAVLVADDVGNVVWRLSVDPATAPPLPVVPAAASAPASPS